MIASDIESEDEEKDDIAGDLPQDISQLNDHTTKNSLVLNSCQNENLKKILKKPSRFDLVKFGRKLNQDEIDAISQHKDNLYLYVFVARCIAFSFHKDNSDEDDFPTHKALLAKHDFEIIRENLKAYLQDGGGTDATGNLGEHFYALNKTFYERVVCQKHIECAVYRHVLSFHDFIDIYKQYVNEYIAREGLTKSTEQKWMLAFELLSRRKDMKVNPEPSHLHPREGLYNLFQQILMIRKDEARIIFNACRVSIHSYMGGSRGLNIFCFVHPPCRTEGEFSTTKISLIF